MFFGWFYRYHKTIFQKKKRKEKKPIVSEGYLTKDQRIVLPCSWNPTWDYLKSLYLSEDTSSFLKGNREGKNPEGFWLWPFSTFVAHYYFILVSEIQTSWKACEAHPSQRFSMGKSATKPPLGEEAPKQRRAQTDKPYSSDCMVSGNCRISMQCRSEEFWLEISVSQTSNRELPKSNTCTPKWMSNEKFVVQRPFAVQPSITCCGFSTANSELWASEPLSSGSVHDMLRLWLDNSICACLCIGSPWLLQLCEFPNEN